MSLNNKQTKTHTKKAFADIRKGLCRFYRVVIRRSSWVEHVPSLFKKVPPHPLHPLDDFFRVHFLERRVYRPFQRRHSLSLSEGIRGTEVEATPPQ